MITKIREVREKLVALQAEVTKLMEKSTKACRELDITSQKIEEAIMWTYRITALEKENIKNTEEDIPVVLTPEDIRKMVIKALYS